MNAPIVEPPDRRTTVFVGVDAGGSHTEAVATDPGGGELGRVGGGPGAVSPGRAAEAADQMGQTVLTLLGKIRRETPVAALCVGAAGVGRSAEREALARALESLGLADRVTVVTDAEIAFESAFPRAPGVLLLAGTGSIAYRRDAAGTLRRAGGLGWQLGDEGGGYAIARAALALAGRTLDGRGSAPALAGAILAATGERDLDGLTRWAQGAGRRDVAALAGRILALAGSGESAARELVQGAAGDLAALLLALAGDAPKGTRLALGGSLLSGESPLRTEVITTISRVLPNLTPITTTVDPPAGAAALARAGTV